ncbi:MAG: glycosyl hydrolase family 17 protein [Flavobacteriaceae bacterium]|tara:strand:+ start:8212 stop:9510 length:1299 start_codon:yes stop_codon:yes gene_type:complete
MKNNLINGINLKVISNYILLLLLNSILLTSCSSNDEKKMKEKEITAQEILNNPEYLAISYGGYRKNTRDIQPTIDELKEDLQVLSSIGIKILRTYNLQLDQAPNILKAITELKHVNPEFEMYVMLGAWIDCESAWTENPDHTKENESANAIEIQKAINLANQYPEIVKIIAVGNEAMVNWAWSYYVEPSVILGWVNHLQDLKKQKKLPENLWITSSDNFAAWGGGEESYHTNDLNSLIKAVDYISMHTYAFHDTHYNADFWNLEKKPKDQNYDLEIINQAMDSVHNYSIYQYNSVKNYLKKIGVDKQVHIGELGWSTKSNRNYGRNGSRAADEYKQAVFHDKIRKWTKKEKIACFYFSAFDESWKDFSNTNGSENHFGLFTVDGKAKYALWKNVDNGDFKGLTRNGNSITKTYNGNSEDLLNNVLTPSVKNQ